MNTAREKSRNNDISQKNSFVLLLKMHALLIWEL